jgi:hypothetical protein
MVKWARSRAADSFRCPDTDAPIRRVCGLAQSRRRDTAHRASRRYCEALKMTVRPGRRESATGSKGGRFARTGQTVTLRVVFPRVCDGRAVEKRKLERRSLGHAWLPPAPAGVKEGRCGNSFPLEWGAGEFLAPARGKSFPRPGFLQNENAMKDVLCSFQYATVSISARCILDLFLNQDFRP